jgi:hypothetical protein
LRAWDEGGRRAGFCSRRSSNSPTPAGCEFRLSHPPLDRASDFSLIALGDTFRPRNGGDVFSSRLHSPDGDDLREATSARQIHRGEEILFGNGRRFRVLAVVPFEENESPLVGLLQVEEA